jgi:hypothetical protein
MLNYFKNFIAKLALLPVLALLGATFLLFFLFIPQFKLFKDVKHWRLKERGNYGDQKEKDYEAFY